MVRRVLHVANAYSQYQNMSPSQLIQAIHDNMYRKFVATAKGKNKMGAGSAAEAKELQNFFQGLKYYSKYQNADHLAAEVDLSTIQQVLANINPKFSRLMHNLFRFTSSRGYEQGGRFEDDLALVIEEVLSMGSGKTIENGITKIGTEQINIGGQLNATIDIDGMAKEIISSVGTTVYKRMKDIKTKYNNVQGKIDISGLRANVTIIANPNSYLARIAYLLSKANISAKSYASGYWTWREGIRMRISKMFQELGLGSTDLRRIYTDIFTKEAGTPPPVSLSLYMYLKNTKNNAIKEAASRLRFIYELTGYGQTYINKAIQDVLDAGGIGHANYFIYNDPASDNIYVQSTASIISEMWNEIQNLMNKGSVSLSKTFFA